MVTNYVNGDAGRCPTIYFVDEYHPEAVKYSQERAHTIVPGDPEHANWRQNAKYVLVGGTKFSRQDIASCPNLQAIGKRGTGIDKIDTVACKERGIKILNTPGINARAVAEMVLALTMSVAREVGRAAVKQQRGELVTRGQWSGLMLHNTTVGIIGMGNIGEQVARIFRGAFHAEVIAYDPYVATKAWKGIPHTRANTLDELLQAADVVTLHVPLLDSTRRLISYRELHLMKRNAIIINAARGGIVDERDLEQALREGLIWGAGLDCHEHEPPTKEHYAALWELGVVSTPHIAAKTAQTQMNTAIAAVKQVIDFAMETGYRL
ncbi:hypothetical protein M409DRAFT_28462 [Zasmidium cellare ATCC 36951]|uniref:D-3-phosphoglycerate dehydrogenase n=1 Tax=Zasmidium cellare ATCC 36951 TaxID=1080233 RepID=A0A6A6C5I1_ZASCE|nr:uncharacterized protein M409DRAFT_28462 [Zasmidium cellare ATCC 36951]KAF2161132.1 hypothetical protein M409DRAFT_28462 [Zasmidium cellare ATCC 36951]